MRSLLAMRYALLKKWRLFILSSLIFFICACQMAPIDSELGRKKGADITLFALSLIDTGYVFGGKNPEAGLDCSGMVSYVYQQSIGITLKGSAADIAQKGNNIDKQYLRAGDLVFFNTQGRAYSHVGIYIGNQRFIHAPSSRGKVRIDRLDNTYYAQRYETAKRYVN